MKYDATESAQVAKAHANAIELAGVSRLFQRGDEKVHALQQVTLTLPEGSMTGLCGPSGSGKSTLLRIAGALDRPTSGTVHVRGEAIHAATEKQLEIVRRNSIGFVFQRFNLVPVLTAVENVEIGMFWIKDAKERRERAMQALAAVGLSHRIQHKPAHLSGGEQQRVSIARAIAKMPALVIADEPTANLDSKNALHIFELFAELNETKRVSFLIASHDERLLGRLSAVVTMRDGRLQ